MALWLHHDLVDSDPAVWLTSCSRAWRRAETNRGALARWDRAFGRAPAAGSGRDRMLSPLFCEKTQLELEAHAAQDVAGAVADRDRVMRAVVE